MMKVGIVGMPNAGKSSLFNALSQAGAQAANYPFTTIEPNVAVVRCDDERLDAVARTVGAPRTSCRTRSSSTTSPASWPARTRARGWATSSWPTSARPTRCCTSCAPTSDPNVIHPEGRVDPAADMDTIETELIYADLEQAERRHARLVRDARGGDRAAIAEEAWLREVIAALQAGRPVRTRAAARGGAARRARPRRADRQAGALRGQRRRGRRRGARRSWPSTPRPPRPARWRSPRGSRPSCPSSTTTRRPRCARSSGSPSPASSASSTARSRCST